MFESNSMGIAGAIEILDQRIQSDQAPHPNEMYFILGVLKYWHEHGIIRPNIAIEPGKVIDQAAYNRR